MPSSPTPEIVRFREFELDLPAYELRRDGRPVKIGRQAMEVLILLVERRRQLLSRADIVDRLWGKDVFVDVETGVNTAISKVRQALRDSTDAPVFVETVPGKGYRFIADVVVATEPPTTNQAPDVRPHLRSQRVRAPLLIGLVTTATLVAGLVAWTTLRSAAPARVSLAVLPFQNLGNDAERGYLASGLTEETSAQLGQIDPEHLIVKGRPLRYRDTTKSALEIGRELAVDYLVETSMSAEGDRVRLTTRLLRVRDEEHVWSQTFEREATNLLVLQQELSSAIAEQIRITLSPGSLGGLARRQTKNAEAYDAYLRARYLAGQRTPSANAAAIEQYRRATTIDRDYALAWSALAQTYAASTINADAPPLEMGPRAREAAANALRSNADLAETQMAAGYVNWLVDWNWSVAEIAFRRAIHLDASNGAAYRSLGHALSQAGRRKESEDAMRRARELEPLDPQNHALSSQVAFQNRDYDAAAEHAHRAVIMAPTFWIGSMLLAQVRAEQGQTDLALAALADASRFSAGNSKATSLRGYILARQGATAEALAALRQLEDEARARYMPPYAMALIHAGLGERDRVFGLLDAAYAARDVHLIFLTVDPKWDPYRTDPRFIALLRACGFGT